VTSRCNSDESSDTYVADVNAEQQQFAGADSGASAVFLLRSTSATSVPWVPVTAWRSWVIVTDRPARSIGQDIGSHATIHVRVLYHVFGLVIGLKGAADMRYRFNSITVPPRDNGSTTTLCQKSL